MCGAENGKGRTAVRDNGPRKAVGRKTAVMWSVFGSHVQAAELAEAEKYSNTMEKERRVKKKKTQSFSVKLLSSVIKLKPISAQTNPETRGINADLNQIRSSK
jgi:hypothetical protein